MSRFAAIGLFVALLSIVGMASAQAATPAPNGATRTTTTTTSTTASYPPSTSPSVFSCNGKDDIDNWVNCTKCPSGYACAFMCCYNDANYFFRFYYEGTYRLNYWHDSEWMYNHQTDGWSVRTYGQYGGLLHCYPPRSAYYTVDWSPVWSIKLSSQHC